MSENASPTLPAAEPATAPVPIDASGAAVPPALILQQVRSIRCLLLIGGLAVLTLLLLGGLWGYLWHQSYYFYSTDDATVSGDVATAAPKATGTITTVYHHVGSAIHRGDIIAVLQRDDGSMENVRSPIDGSIVQEGATPGEVLQAGEVLAQVVDLRAVYITAYVEDTHIKDVHTNQGVDVAVESVSGVTLHGTVTRVLPVTAATLGSLPTTDYASGNFTKVTQRVPVQISLDGAAGLTLYPGVPASVTIHLHT